MTPSQPSRHARSQGLEPSSSSTRWRGACKGSSCNSARRASSGSERTSASLHRTSNTWYAPDRSHVISPSRMRFSTGRLTMALATEGMFCGSRLREYSRTSGPCLNAIRRMPSNLRSKIHSGPVKRSWVSVAAIGSSHSGKAVVTSRKVYPKRPSSYVCGEPVQRRSGQGRLGRLTPGLMMRFGPAVQGCEVGDLRTIYRIAMVADLP